MGILLLIRYIFRRSNPKNRRILPRARAAHARQSFNFYLNKGTFKMNFFVKSLQKPFFYIEEQLSKDNSKFVFVFKFIWGWSKLCRQTQNEIDHPKDFKTKTPQVGRFQRGIFQTVVVRFRQPLIFLTFEKFKSYSFKIYFSSKMWSNLPRCTVLLIKMPKYYFFCNLFN